MGVSVAGHPPAARAATRAGLARGSPGLALGGLLGLLAVLAWLVPPRPAGGDGPVYLAMARDLGAGTGVQAHRVLGPLLVSWLPLPPEEGFRWLTYAALAGAAALVWGAARVDLGDRAAAWAAAAFLTSWATLGNLWDYHLVDPLAWLLVAACWWGAATRRTWVVAVAGALGGAAKEVVAAAAAASGLALWDRRRPGRSAVRLLAAAGPSVLVVVLLLRWAGFGQGEAGQYWATWSRTVGALGRLYLLQMTFAAYGVLWLAAVPGLRWATPALRRRALWLLLANLPLMALGTPERMVELAAPAVATLAAVALARLPSALAAAALVANTAYVLGTVAGLPPPAPGVWLALATLVVGALASGRAGLRRPGQAAGVVVILAVGGLYLGAGAPHGGFAPIPVDPASLPRLRLDLRLVALSPGVGPDGRSGWLGVVQNQGRQTAYFPRVEGGEVLARAIPPHREAPIFAADPPGRLSASLEAGPPFVVASLAPLQVRLEPVAGGVVVSGRVSNDGPGPVHDVRVAVALHDRSGRPIAVGVDQAYLDSGPMQPGASEPFQVRLALGAAADDVALADASVTLAVDGVAD